MSSQSTSFWSLFKERRWQYFHIYGCLAELRTNKHESNLPLTKQDKRQWFLTTITFVILTQSLITSINDYKKRKQEKIPLLQRVSSL